VKILHVVGARPNFIKIAPIMEEMAKDSGRFQQILVHTGQHYDDEMSQVFFDDLDIPRPDVYLGVGSGSHAEQTAKVMLAFEAGLLEQKPDLVIVVGDVNSTLACALVAVKLHIPVAHVEAGLRSFNRLMPEEINRVLVDHVSDLLLCPTETAVRNLAAEGIHQGVHLVGDVMYDAVLHNSRIAQERSHVLEKVGVQSGEYLLLTVHRPVNADAPARLGAILDTLGQAGQPIVFPVHPRTQKTLSTLHSQVPGNILLQEPVGYLDMLMLEKHARLILTDSGGVQKEAYWFGVPCITLRKETEWVETVSVGWNVLVSADRDRIAKAISSFAPPVERPPLFGDGRAAERVVSLITEVSL
jgi:UDP-GlcNAc3NAcA epimerase